MAHILSLSTTVPQHGINQESLADKIASSSKLNAMETKWLHRVFQNSQIKTRYSVLEEFSKEAESWHFWNDKVPSTKERNEIYKQCAPKLSFDSASKALLAWGGDPSTLTHIIFVSCTGVIAPGIQATLAQQLNLSPDINQFGLNMMGCFGAFKGLDMANAFAKEHPKNRIVVVCTELCSLHFQQSNSRELQIGNTIFADGSAACVVGDCPQENETSLWKIEKFASYIIPQTSSLMTWEVSDTGLVLGLKKEVPKLLKEHLSSFVKKLLPVGINPQDCSWPIHPGGKEILLAIQEALNLSENDLKHSWNVLEEYGNMSSPTFLFVLERLKKDTQNLAVGLGFGPGLCLEGIILKHENSL